MDGLIPALIQSIWRNHERRALVAELLRLNDYLLTDIGLHRNEIGADGAGLFKAAQPVVERGRPAIMHDRINPYLQVCG